MRQHRLLGVAALGVALVTLAGCAGTPGEPPASTDTDFVIGAGEVDSLNTVTTKTNTAQIVAANVYANLMEEEYAEVDGYLSPTGEYIEGLVSDYEVSEDGTVLTFTLDDGLEFADGTPLTSADVVYTMQRTLSEASYVSGSSTVFMRISDPATQIEAVDENTVSVTLDGPAPAIDQFLALSTFGVVNAVAGQAEPGEDGWANAFFTENATPSGPFTLENWSTESVTLARNPSYVHADDVFADEITVLNMPDEDQRFLALRSGDIDVALDLSPQLVEAAQADDSLVVHSIPSNTVYYLGLNPEIAPFDNPAVRQAIAQAIPYELLMDEVMRGQASAAYGVVTSQMETSLAPSADSLAYETDLDAARTLLEDAGISDLTVNLSLSSASDISTDAAVYIQAALAEIGITVNIAPLADADFETRSKAQELGFFIANWSSWAQDPFFQMRALLLTDRATNRTGFANAEFDEAVLAGIVATEEADRAELSERAQQIVIDDASFVGLFTVNTPVVTRADVSGVALGSDLLPRLRYLTR